MAVFVLCEPSRWPERLPALLVLAAWGCDMLDGPIARALRVEGEFGKHFDMLADLVSFGIAPALLAFRAQGTAGPFFLAPLVYVLCGAIRLARYALLSRRPQGTCYFTGFPLPASALTLAALSVAPSLAWLMAPLVLFLGVLMLAPVRFPTFRHPDFARASVWMRCAGCAGILVAAVVDPRLLLLVSAAYLAVGVMQTLFQPLPQPVTATKECGPSA